LAANDLTGRLPDIANENDLLDLYSSLGNAVADSSGIKVGTIVGSFSKISSLTAQSNAMAGDYTLKRISPDQLELTDPLGKAQTVTLVDSVSAGLQTIDFNQLGVTLQLQNTSSALSAVSPDSDIALDTTLPKGLIATQTVSKLDLQNNVQPGVYTFSSSNNELTLTSSNGGSQTISLADGATAGQELNFDQMGISLTVSDLSSPVESASAIASHFDGLHLALQAATDSKEDIATALNGTTLKISGMANPLVNYGLNAANFISLAPSNFASYFNGSTPLISSIKANAVQQMSAVFGTSVSNLVNEVGVKVATWKSNQKADNVVLSNLKAQRDSVSGVNLDEEAANLLKYQQLYTASTKVLQAGNQMFSTLLSIMN
jgi:flagellar hook-associated protein FlgK